MAMIKGISVTLLERVRTGIDDFNVPIYEYRESVVDNVLVAPDTSGEIVTSKDLIGKKETCILAIPKGDDHKWEDAIVRFFGLEWKTIGFLTEGIEENIPLDWNKKIKAERYG